MSDTLSSRVDGMVAGAMLKGFSRLVAGVQFFSLGFACLFDVRLRSTANMTQSDRSDSRVPSAGSVVKVGGWTATPEGILQYLPGQPATAAPTIHVFAADPESSHPSVSGKICAKSGGNPQGLGS